MGEEEEEEVVEFVWTELDVLFLEGVLFFLLEKIFMFDCEMVYEQRYKYGIEKEVGYSFAMNHTCEN